MAALDNVLFSVLITDIFLHDGDRLMVIDLDSERQPDIPVVGILSYLYTELGQKAKQLFGERLFENPFKKKKLIGKVRDLVGNIE